MAKELNVSYAEELSPDEYLGEDPQEEAGREETEKKKAEKKEEGEYVSKLISPWEVARAFREDKVLARWKEELDLMTGNLTDCTFNFYDGWATGSGWRQHANYYKMREIFGMFIMY